MCPAERNGFEQLQHEASDRHAEMFNACSSLTALDLSSFNTSNVNDMSRMFSSCSGLTELDLSLFDTGQVTSM